MLNKFWRLRPRMKDTGVSHYHQGEVFLPGAQSAVFEMPFTLPVQPIWGQAIMAGRILSGPYQPPQVYQARGTTTAGLGGLLHGQMALQSLIVPSDNENTTGG